MATWRAYWRDADGVLVDQGWIRDRTPPPGQSTRSYGDTQPVGQWDTTLRDYDGIVPKPRIISTFRFMELWTQAEREALRDSTQAAAIDFDWMLRVMDDVDLDGAYVVTKMSQISGPSGVMTNARAAAILAGDDL